MHPVGRPVRSLAIAPSCRRSSGLSPSGPQNATETSAPCQESCVHSMLRTYKRRYGIARKIGAAIVWGCSRNSARPLLPTAKSIWRLSRNRRPISLRRLTNLSCTVYCGTTTPNWPPLNSIHLHACACIKEVRGGFLSTHRGDKVTIVLVIASSSVSRSPCPPRPSSARVSGRHGGDRAARV